MKFYYETADLEFLFPDGSGAWADRYGESDLFHGRNSALGRCKSCDSGRDGLSGSPGCFSALRNHRLWFVEGYRFLYKREKKKSGVEQRARVFLRFFCLFLHMDKRARCVY